MLIRPLDTEDSIGRVHKRLVRRRIIRRLPCVTKKKRHILKVERKLFKLSVLNKSIKALLQKAIYFLLR